MSVTPKSERWPIWKLSVALYPLAAGAAAVNLFFLSLIGQAVGLRALTPVESIIGGVIFGLPFAWIAGRWMRGLIDEAEDSPM